MNKIIFGVFLSLLASAATYGMTSTYGMNGGDTMNPTRTFDNMSKMENTKQVRYPEIDSREPGFKKKEKKLISNEKNDNRRERESDIVLDNSKEKDMVIEIDSEIDSETLSMDEGVFFKQYEESKKSTPDIGNGRDNANYSNLDGINGRDSIQPTLQANQQVSNKVTKEAHNEVTEEVKWKNPFEEDMFLGLNQEYINIFKAVWDKSFYKFRKVTNEQQVTTMITPQQVATKYVEFANKELKEALREEAEKKIAIWLVSLGDLLEVDRNKFKEQLEIFGLIGNDVRKACWNWCFYYNKETTGPVLDNFIWNCLSNYILKDLNKYHKGEGRIEKEESVQKGKGYRFVGFEMKNGKYTGVLSKDSFNKIKEKYLNKFSSNASHWLQALIRPRDLRGLKEVRGYKLTWDNEYGDMLNAKLYFTRFISQLIRTEKEKTKTEDNKNKKYTINEAINPNILMLIPDDEKNNF